VLGWLATTAVREVFKLSRRQAREPSLEAALEEPDGLADAVAWIGCPERAVEASERIGALRALPERQQRLLWLQASGLSYGEISGQTGDTIRTVERQLHSARLALKAR
jgi:DNA-directed RNA polymerase specialized sigma24 family protein